MFTIIRGGAAFTSVNFVSYRVTQKKGSLAICALVDPTWHSRMIHRVEYQSKTLSNILSWLITQLFNLIAHSNTILAPPGTLNEVEVPSKQPQAGASAFEPRLQNRASNEHFFVQKSAQYLHKILNVCIKVWGQRGEQNMAEFACLQWPPSEGTVLSALSLLQMDTLSNGADVCSCL